MGSTVTVSVGADVPEISSLAVADIDTVLTSGRARFKWESANGDVITLFGAFSYSSGSELPNLPGAVSRVKIDFASSGAGEDMDFQITGGGFNLGNLISGSNAFFWRALQGGDDTIVVSEDAQTFDLSLGFDKGFTADTEFASTGFGSDDLTIQGAGNFSADSLSAIDETGVADTVTIDRSDAGADVLVVGDFMKAAFAGTRTVTGGDDVIVDVSSDGGLTVLVGDIGNASAGVSVVGGNDVITAGSVAALLIGDLYKFSAADPLSLIGGGDTLTGGSADDVLVGDIYDADASTSTTHSITGGDDFLFGGAGADVIYGEYALSDFGDFSGGHDTIKGGTGADTIYGQTGQDSVSGNGGKDLIYGGNGSDTLAGGSGADTVFAESGADSVSGGGGGDTLKGGARDDTLSGGQGKDDLYGGADDDLLLGGNGNDTLSGDAGNDTLTGGNGADVFVFATGDGNDTITDFDVSKSGEAIDLSALAAITDYADLQADHMEEIGSDVVIDSYIGESVTLKGVSLVDLNEAHFLF